MLTQEWNLEEALAYRFQEGREEGIVEGEAKTKARIVRNALKKNMAVEDIAELAGLTVEEVRNLVN